MDYFCKTMFMPSLGCMKSIQSPFSIAPSNMLVQKHLIDKTFVAVRKLSTEKLSKTKLNYVSIIQTTKFYIYVYVSIFGFSIWEKFLSEYFSTSFLECSNEACKARSECIRYFSLGLNYIMGFDLRRHLQSIKFLRLRGSIFRTRKILIEIISNEMSFLECSEGFTDEYPTLRSDRRRIIWE